MKETFRLAGLENQMTDLKYRIKAMSYLNRMEVILGGKRVYELDNLREGGGLSVYSVDEGKIQKSWVHMDWALDNLKESLDRCRKIRLSGDDSGIKEILEWLRELKRTGEVGI